MRDIDPFTMMFEAPYQMSMVPTICDMIDATIGSLREPPDEAKPARMVSSVRAGYVFVAMAMNDEDHALVDVLEAIKAAAKECGLVAERIDDDNRNERITDRILESIRMAEYVTVDLTNERPNVFYEAGYAHALGKIPIYIARHGTKIHFDVKDYPIIFFKNMKELRESLVKRLRSIATEKK
jgi:nucleoside 2-deoxyribosyltransferase